MGIAWVTVLATNTLHVAQYTLYDIANRGSTALPSLITYAYAIYGVLTEQETG